MITPTYRDVVTVGSDGQTKTFKALPTELINRQSGDITLVHVDQDGLPFDVSSLTGSDFKSVPFDSGETPTTLAAGVVSYASEKFTITASATPATSGTFTITVAGETTTAIAYNADDVTVLAALVALASRTGGDFTSDKIEGLDLGVAGAQILIESSGGFAIEVNSTLDDALLVGGSLTINVSESGSDVVNTYNAAWAKDLIPAAYSEYPVDRNGAIVFFVALEDADDFYQSYQRITIVDDAFIGSGGAIPSSATFIYNPNDNNAWLRYSTAAPTQLGEGLDKLVAKNFRDFGTVISFLATPPGSPADGDAHLVIATATGAFAGEEDKIARYSTTLAAWDFSNVHKEGDRIGNIADGFDYNWDGTSSWDQVVFVAGDNSITNAKLSDVSSLTIKGRLTGGVGNPEDLSATQAKQVLLLQNVDNTSDAGKPVSTAQQTALDLKLDEADVTVAQFNASVILGKDIDTTTMTAPSNGEVITYNSGTGEWEAAAGAGGGTAGGVEFQLNFETDITSSEPASGGIKYNSATPGSVTVIRASATDANGVDINDRLSTIGAGDSFYTRVLSDVTKFLKVSVTTSVFVTTSYDITCTIVTAGVLPAGSDTMGIDPEIITVGGATGVSSFNGRTLAVMPSPSDYDSTDIADASTAGGPTTEDSFDAIVLNKMAIADYDAAAISEQLVGLTATQSLTNKTVNAVVLTDAGAGNLFLQDDGSYGTPAGGGDMATATYDAAAIAEQLVGLTATQSLTNKTINTVVLDSTGAATSYLDQTGSYSVPGGGGGGEANTASNVGGGQGVFYQKTGVDLEFKSVVSNNGTCNITSSTTELDVEAAGLYQNIYIDAAAMVPRTTNGAEALTKEFATNDIMIDYLAYDSTTEEGAQFKMMIPDRWDGGTIKFKFYWDAAATASGTVIWGVSAGALSDSDAIDTALGTQITVTDTLLTVGDMHISPATAAVTIAGTPALGDMIIFQVVATTGGTIAVDQFLMGVGIQYNESDTPQVIW